MQLFLKINSLKIFANFSGEPQACNFIKKRIQHKCFPVKFLRTPFSTEQMRSLLFKIRNSNNLFQDISAISLTHNQSLITCNSQNNKLI